MTSTEEKCRNCCCCYADSRRNVIAFSAGVPTRRRRFRVQPPQFSLLSAAYCCFQVTNLSLTVCRRFRTNDVVAAEPQFYVPTTATRSPPLPRYVTGSVREHSRVKLQQHFSNASNASPASASPSVYERVDRNHIQQCDARAAPMYASARSRLSVGSGLTGSDQ